MHNGIKVVLGLGGISAAITSGVIYLGNSKMMIIPDLNDPSYAEIRSKYLPRMTEITRQFEDSFALGQKGESEIKEILRRELGYEFGETGVITQHSRENIGTYIYNGLLKLCGKSGESMAEQRKKYCQA